MKKAIQNTVLFCALSFGIISCSSDSSSSSTQDDFVKDAESLMRKMTLSGAVLKNGDIPVPSGLSTDEISAMPNTVIVTSNSLFSIPIETNISDGRVPRIVFIKLEGSDKYYQIDLDLEGNPVSRRTTNDDHRIRLDCSGNGNIMLEANPMVEDNSYINAAEVYVYSPPLQTPVEDLTNFLNARYWSLQRLINFKVLDVGTGDVQVSLTWDTRSDVDLWLTEPNGNKIYYANSNSATGGQLDFDNTVEYGPENIFYNTTAPSGTYKVEVNYYSGAPQVTHYNVVVKNGSNISSYDGTLTSGSQTNTVAIFNK